MRSRSPYWTPEDIRDMSEGYRADANRVFKDFKKPGPLDREDKIVNDFLNNFLDVSDLAKRYKTCSIEVQRLLESKGIL